MDESVLELTSDVSRPIPMALGSDAKEDHHYQRHGSRAIFMFIDPLRGWRRVRHYEHRTRLEWAEEVKQLLEVDYPKARKVKLVCDNLNTHHIGALYYAFPAAEARRLARRLEIHYTPRNGSWLNIAEIELSVLQRQCLERRMPNDETLQRELKAWQDQRNQTHAKVYWRFSTHDARIKLRHL